MRATLPGLLALAAAGATSLAGCADELTPGSVLDRTRILAVTSDPLEAGPGDEVTADALVYVAPGDGPETRAWTFCPLTTGAGGGYRCVLDACETALPPSRTVNPYAQAEACLAAVGGAPPGGAPGEPVVVESVLRLRVQTAPREARGEPPLEAVLRLPLSTSPPAERNLAPVIARVTVGGAPATAGAVAGSLPAAGGRLAIAAEIDPASIQTYVDTAGRTVAESIVVSFFTTAGRFTDERGEAPRAETVLEARELPAGATGAEVWVLARDLRGGQAWDGPFLITIDP
jgi:hypothetical protein